MATRKKFSRERLEAAGERSVQAVLAKLGEEFGDLVSDVSVVCRYFCSVIRGMCARVKLCTAVLNYQVRGLRRRL